MAGSGQAQGSDESAVREAIGSTPLRYADLPDDVDPRAIEGQRRGHLYGYLTRPLIADLAAYCAGKNVLEVYAGRGHLAALLEEQGVAIKATSLRSGHDGSRQLGHVTAVEELSVVDAVKRYADWMDVLLVCWPTTDMATKVRALDSGTREYRACDALQQTMSRLYRQAGIKLGSSHSGRRTLAARVKPYLSVDQETIRRAFELALA